MAELSRLGVIGRSRKEDERRVPIHPAHFDVIPESVRGKLIFERGYGEPLGVEDSELEAQFGGVADRAELLRVCDGVLLPKPVVKDLEELREGGLLWGWPHCVQQMEITRTALERRQTLLAFESMFTWRNDVRGMHLFYRNNEMAGYCGVIHALTLMGIDGYYGPPRQTVVLSLGSVSRGATQALKGLGVSDITVFTQRAPVRVRDRVLGCRYGRIVRESDGPASVITPSGARRSMVDVLAEADVTVNGILQDTDRPLMYLREGEERCLKRGSLIVDVSCDRGMGFPFARPTSFVEPTFRVGPATYYAVDHTPSYLWRSASWEISEVVVTYLKRVLGGPERWERDETLRRAIEVREGEILNPKVMRFQERHGET